MEAALATSSLALYGVTVSVELARRSSVKGDGSDRLVLGIEKSGKDLQNFIFQEINSHGDKNLGRTTRKHPGNLPLRTRQIPLNPVIRET